MKTFLYILYKHISMQQQWVVIYDIHDSLWVSLHYPQLVHKFFWLGVEKIILIKSKYT